MTEAGTVYLLGLVTRKEGDDAAEIARTTAGVQKVVRVFEYIEFRDDSDSTTASRKTPRPNRRKRNSQPCSTPRPTSRPSSASPASWRPPCRLARPLVFTNGCFDILHRGHVTYLAQARALGASLVVAAEFGRLRPAAWARATTVRSIRLEDRMAVLAALQACRWSPGSTRTRRWR